MSLKLPIERSEFGSAWADSLASLMVRLHETQGGRAKHSVRIASLTRDLCSALDSGHACLSHDRLEKIEDYHSPIIVTAEQALKHVAPLVLEQSRLYLYRYWFDEYQLAQAIKQLKRPRFNTDYGRTGYRQNVYPRAYFNGLTTTKLAVKCCFGCTYR